MSRADLTSVVLPLTLGLLAAACVPNARSGVRINEREPVYVDGGFDDAGNPVDGGIIIPDPDAGFDDLGHPVDSGPSPRDSGVEEGPPDATVVNVVYDECPDNAHSLEVPIIANDRSNSVARSPALTSFLVPFAEGEALYSLNSLVVKDASGARLPAQFEVLSRWGGVAPGDCGKPIRYAYAHVMAAPAPGSEAQWKVESQANNPGESTPLTLSESAQAWVVDTGAARFTVERQPFRGLSKVELPDGQGGFTVVSALAAGQSSFVLEHMGLKEIGAQAPWALRLERSGPQVVTVAARGYYAAAGGGARDLGYTVRLSFYAGSTTVKVDHTYYYGDVAGWGADGVSNRTQVGGAWMRVPFSAGASEITVRADQQVHTRAATEAVRVEQQKRAPGDIAVRYAVSAAGSSLESGQFADHPYLAVAGGGVHATATLGRMNVREPQGLSWNESTQTLVVEMTSTPMYVGGARGIWTQAALSFGRGAPSGQDALQLHAERPLLGTPAPAYANTTRTIGPYAANAAAGPAAAYVAKMANLHQRTRTYLRDLKITGVQIWPDLPRASCNAEFNCNSVRNALYEGGDNNYWNWSKPGLDEFFRTGNNDFIYDFSLGEAITYVETLAVRTYHDRITDSSVMGLAVCYGDSRGYSGDYREGLNNRRDRCVADYSYDKALKLAFLATGDARFVDFFEEAGESVVNAFGAPPARPDEYLEVDLSRLSEQRLEVLTDGAEFGRDPALADNLRVKIKDYVDWMVGRVLIDGHMCYLSGSGYNDARDTGSCGSTQAWMLPVGVEWAMRTSRLLGHDPLAQWLTTAGQRAGQHFAVLNGQGVPDFARAGGTWRTVYRCSANQGGVDNASCQKLTNGENNNLFYNNGLMAFLNVFGVVLAADPTDPNRICQWLPAAFTQQVNGLSDSDVNFHIWGKDSGQAFALSAEAAGALSSCP
jgi:hypothetical protein